MKYWCQILPHGTPLAVQWLRRCASNARDTGLIPGWELRFLMPCDTAKKKNLAPPKLRTNYAELLIIPNLKPRPREAFPPGHWWPLHSSSTSGQKSGSHPSFPCFFHIPSNPSRHSLGSIFRIYPDLITSHQSCCSLVTVIIISSLDYLKKLVPVVPVSSLIPYCFHTAARVCKT